MNTAAFGSSTLNPVGALRMTRILTLRARSIDRGARHHDALRAEPFAHRFTNDFLRQTFALILPTRERRTNSQTQVETATYIAGAVLALLAHQASV
jgi:hypothetical protein